MAGLTKHQRIPFETQKVQEQAQRAMARESRLPGYLLDHHPASESDKDCKTTTTSKTFSIENWVSLRDSTQSRLEDEILGPLEGTGHPTVSEGG